MTCVAASSLCETRRASSLEVGCVFRCLGCNRARCASFGQPGQPGSTEDAEAEPGALAAHLRLLLNEVLRVRAAMPAVSASPKLDMTPLLGYSLYSDHLERKSTERLPGPLSGPTPSLRGADSVVEDEPVRVGHSEKSAGGEQPLAANQMQTTVAGAPKRWQCHQPPPRLGNVVAAMASTDDLLGLLESAPPHRVARAQAGAAIIPEKTAAVTFAQNLDTLADVCLNQGNSLSLMSSVASPQGELRLLAEEEEEDGNDGNNHFVSHSVTMIRPLIASGGAPRPSIDNDSFLSADRAAGVPMTRMRTLRMGEHQQTHMQPHVADLGSRGNGDSAVGAGVAESTGVDTDMTRRQQAHSQSDRNANEIALQTLNEVTAELQAHRLTHAEGKLWATALLNRAHCYMELGEYSLALADVDAVLGEEGAEVVRWYKVWMCRGAVLRRLAQASIHAHGGPSSESADLSEQANAAFRRVLELVPAVAGASVAGAGASSGAGSGAGAGAAGAGASGAGTGADNGAAARARRLAEERLLASGDRRQAAKRPRLR